MVTDYESEAHIDARAAAGRQGEVPGEVYETIRLALQWNLREYHRKHPAQLPSCDLYVYVVSAVKWARETNPGVALYLTQSALTAVADDDGPTLDDAAACLRHSLTQESPGHNAWSYDEASRFVTAALLAR
ncbi:hypothetical protein [Streptomyces sp. NBC_00057]|uniref:hypothetical protein n=1 Tax=Streptomyces sp. NBC_00057 TaxID=2975634 RepID=UPI00324B3DD5